MKEFFININFETNKIYSRKIELTQNDFNSIKLKFQFDKEFKKALFKLKYPDDIVYVDEIVNNEMILKKGVLSQAENYKYEVSIYDEDSRLTNVAIGDIYVREELVDTDEIVEVDDRLPILDSMLNDILDLNNNLTDNGNYAKEQGDKAMEIVNQLSEKLASGDFQGPKGDSFTYEDFTPEQLESLKGPKGDPGNDGVVDYTAIYSYIDNKIGNINSRLSSLTTISEDGE